MRKNFLHMVARRMFSSAVSDDAFSARLPAWMSGLFCAALFTATETGIWAADMSALPLRGLNDTGQTTCYEPTGYTARCDNVDLDLGSANDARFGRDSAAIAGALRKTGSGEAGFDFTKISNQGKPLPESVRLGTLAEEWSCTRDNVTGLIWEVKVLESNDPRYVGNRYTWYSDDDSSNGYDKRIDNRGTARGSQGKAACTKKSEVRGVCNTAEYVSVVNRVALCGFSDWRMPSLQELQSLVSFDALSDRNNRPDYDHAQIDPKFFPDVRYEYPTKDNNYYWTATNYAPNPTFAWLVEFNPIASSSAMVKRIPNHIRLVRDGRL